MEHRLHQREPVDLVVGLVDGGQMVAKVRAVDMSPGGLSIETPRVPLQNGQGVGIDFCKSGYPRGISCCLSAMVVHTGAVVTGLMYTSEGPLKTMAHGGSGGSMCSYK